MEVEPSKRIKGILMSVMALPFLLFPNIAGTTYYYEAPEPKTVDSLITIYAKKYGVDEQLARDIIRCESNFFEDALNTKAIVGEDVGIFQLNSYYWQEHMAEKGWDIYNTEDNIEAGMWLLNEQGSQPWLWSKHCWF